MRNKNNVHNVEKRMYPRQSISMRMITTEHIFDNDEKSISMRMITIEHIFDNDEK